MNKQTNWNSRWFHPDVSKFVRNHLLGERYSRNHRFVFGLVISFFGVVISHYAPHVGVEFIAILGHNVGYAIHGLGYIPMFKAFEGGKS